jgi:hypothetical protein
VVKGTLARAHGTEGGALAAVIWRDGSHGHRVLVDSHADVPRASLAQG